MRVGIIGTGAIAKLHARVYASIGYTVRACTDIDEAGARRFATATGAEFVADYKDLCRHPEIDYVDVCTFPNFRLEPLLICAEHRRHIQVQKPMAIDVATAREMIDVARQAGILLSVVSQHRFDDSTQFLASALRDGRLGKLLQCDAYVKWHRDAQYYSRPIKGSWATEGGGALINQAIHQVDLMCALAGPVREVFGRWQLGAVHHIESEDVVSAVIEYESGATGVLQAATAFWPGYPERVELHGARGSAIVTGDRLTRWDVQDDAGAPAPVSLDVASGASDPMAISTTAFERQFLDFGAAIAAHRPPLVSGEEGYQALAVVEAIYRSCRTKLPVRLQ
jgi:UDP-N-acetyl-2-amino-2-deoxyglucuronate dehydrogenase